MSTTLKTRGKLLTFNLRLMKLSKIVIIFSVIIFVSCKFGSKNKTQNPNDKPVSKLTELDALAMVSEIYDSYQNSEEFLIKGLFYPANFLSQDFNLWSTEGSYYKSFNIPTDNININKFWILSYDGIIKANKAIATLDAMAADNIISSELASHLKAECYFNRGLFYFLLAENFGNVPITKNTLNTDAINEPNANQNTVFKYIIADFEKAKTNLPFSYKDSIDIGRATKGASLAYLGESYMWVKDFDRAVLAFNELEDHYELISNFLDIHAYKHQNNKESIFEIQFKSNDNLGWGRDNYSTFIQSFALPNEVGGEALAYVNADFVKSFEKNDRRAKATVIGIGQTHPDTSIHISTYNSVQEKYQSMNTLGTQKKPWLGNDGTRSGYYGIKTWRSPDPNATASAIFSKANVILLRYGQVLLDLAESQYKTGAYKASQKSLNKIRKRAGLNALFPTDMMPILLDEYRHELAGEYSLWYVLRRSANHIEYIKSNFNIDIPKGHDLLPIPQEQLRLNPKLKQNFGY